MKTVLKQPKNEKPRIEKAQLRFFILYPNLCCSDTPLMVIQLDVKKTVGDLYMQAKNTVPPSSSPPPLRPQSPGRVIHISSSASGLTLSASPSHSSGVGGGVSSNFLGSLFLISLLCDKTDIKI